MKATKPKKRKQAARPRELRKRITLRLSTRLLSRLERERLSLCVSSRAAIAELAIAEWLERRALMRGEIPLVLPPELLKPRAPVSPPGIPAKPRARRR